MAAIATAQLRIAHDEQQLARAVNNPVVDLLLDSTDSLFCAPRVQGVRSSKKYGKNCRSVNRFLPS